MGTFTVAGKAKERGVENIDARLVDIIRRAAEQSPYDVELFSGKRYGRGSRHDVGQAVDIVLSTPDGQQIPNLASKEGFAPYERFAQTAREIQKANYPELNNQFRWGGYFSPSGRNPSAFDTMHFDLRPGAPMAFGNFETGLNARGLAAFAKLGAGKIYSATGIRNAEPQPGTYANFWGGEDFKKPPKPVGRNIARLPRREVRQIQETLQRAGFNIEVDGIAGPQTRRALTEYQDTIRSAVDSVDNMTPDAPGFVGPATRMALDLLRDRQAQTPTPRANPHMTAAAPITPVERSGVPDIVREDAPIPRANPARSEAPIPRPNPTRFAQAPIPRANPNRVSPRTVRPSPYDRAQMAPDRSVRPVNSDVALTPRTNDRAALLADELMADAQAAQAIRDLHSRRIGVDIDDLPVEAGT